MMDSKQAVISELDNLLTGFLKTYAVTRLDRLKAEKQVNRLREITFGGKRHYNRMDDRFTALEDWFVENRDLLSRKAINDKIRDQIKECVDQIGAYCRGDINFNDEQAILYDRKKAARIAGIASQFIRRKTDEKGESAPVRFIKPPELDEEMIQSPLARHRDINDRLKDSLIYQLKMHEYFRKTDQHPFTAVNNLLKTIENNSDIRINHMVASVLYFLKLNGYKVAPYVEQLRKAGRQNDD